MYSTSRFHQPLAYGLMCAGALVLPSLALAASGDDASQATQQGQMSQSQSGQTAPSRADALSDEINTFNQNHGSLKEDSSARYGDEDDAGSNGANGTMRGESPRDSELSNEINTFNDNGGTLRQNSDARSGANGERSNTAGQMPPESGDHGASERSRELSQEIEQYNKNNR